MAEQSYRVSAVTSVPGERSPVSFTGEFDPARQVGEETNSFGLLTRYVGSYIYLRETPAWLKAFHLWRLPPARTCAPDRQRHGRRRPTGTGPADGRGGADRDGDMEARGDLLGLRGPRRGEPAACQRDIHLQQLDE